ncbi:MAG TPA: protein kinase [Candidatus Polarisedimenticolaceae bacterium]|nr:protein kinase [Candidatus Polarisedimenticolaceae bacterium]
MTEYPADPASRDVLLESEPFKALRPRLTDQVFAATRERRYTAGEAIIRQGQRGDALFVIIDGEARVTLRDHDGTARPIATVGAGAVAGEMSLITQEPATADVIAETDVRALVLPAADFDALAAKNPELTIVLTNVVADRLGRGLVDGLGGKVLNGYRIVRCVGRGGMAVVYEAIETKTGERVALKMMSHRLVYQPGAHSRFEREARIVEPLAHPNIARMLGHFPAFRTEFIVMEFCEGATLADLLTQRGAFPEREARRVLGQLARALVFVHDRGVVHRDLKPGNIMLTPDGNVKLMDFGLAKEDRKATEDTATQTGTILGTPLYMPPGQMTGEESGPPIDIYAFACIAYELVAGAPLFEGRTTRALLQDKLTRRLPPAEQIGPGISAEFHELLRTGIDNDPEQRLQSLRGVAAWGEG